MSTTEKTKKRRNWRIRRNPEKSPINLIKKKLEQPISPISEDNVEIIDGSPKSYVQRIDQLSQKIQIMIDEQEHEETQYQLLKMMYLDDIDTEFVVNNLGISESELKSLVDELIERGFIQLISDDEAEITDIGIRYLKWRDFEIETL